MIKEKPILKGEHVTLRPITVADAAGMFASMSDEEGMRLTGTQGTFTFEQTEAFCKKVESADDRADYAITVNPDPTYIGEVVLNDFDFVNKSAGFRIALGSAQHYGKGYGTEATKLILAYGFRTLQLHRIALEVYEFNPRALRVYEKCGFVQEGVHRDVLLWDGEWQSAVSMSILAPDFFANNPE